MAENLPKEGNGYPGTGNTEGPKQDEHTHMRGFLRQQVKNSVTREAP